MTNNVNANYVSQEAMREARADAVVVEAMNDVVGVDESQTNFHVRLSSSLLERVENLDTQLDGMIVELQENNENTRRANDFINSLRAIRPDGEETIASGRLLAMISNFDLQHGISSTGEYDLAGIMSGMNGGEAIDSAKIDQMIEMMRNHVSGINTTQQTMHIRLERFNNSRSEALQIVASL